MSQIRIKDHTGKSLPFVAIRISEGTEPQEAAVFDVLTKADGSTGWPIPNWPDRLRTLYINQGDYKQSAYADAIRLSTDVDANGDLDVTLQPSLMGQEQGQLRVSGRDFITDDGQPWHFRGYTMHYILQQALKGVDIDAMLDEPIELGANVIIGIGLHCSPWKTQHGWRCTPIEHPNFYEKLAELFDKAAARKIRIAWAPLADVQFYPGDVQDYWRRSCEVMKGRWNVIARKGNESRHNGWSEDDFTYPDMGGVLKSQGSKGGEDNPHVPYLDFCEFELRRDIPKMFVDAPLRQLMDGDFPGPATNRPTVSIEPVFFHDTNPDHVGDSRCTDPRVALELGILTGLCAGGGFGASDGLECKRLQPKAREIAEQYFRGMTAGFQRPLLGGE